MAMNANLDLAEVPSDIFQPHVILPSQHFTRPGKLTPEHRLMIAVLDNALQSLEKYRFATKRRGRRLFGEVTQWLLAEETDWPFSFECICAVLDLDAQAVRQRLRLVLARPPTDNLTLLPARSA